jgi:hypothetical protein
MSLRMNPLSLTHSPYIQPHCISLIKGGETVDYYLARTNNQRGVREECQTLFIIDSPSTARRRVKGVR